MPKPARLANSSTVGWRWSTATSGDLSRPQSHNHKLLDKPESNIKDLQPRAGELYDFAVSEFPESEGVSILPLPEHYGELMPIDPARDFVATVVLPAALVKCTDVDEPRNPAKSVTVE
jgi:glucosamine 6-phosphate synthetase-like amidotransferase/phosphosugar isomerase protein